MPPRRSLIAALLAVGCMLALPVQAFERPFPPHAKRGVMKPDVFPGIVIDGRPRILTAGARIVNADNLVQMPSSLPAGNYVVNYTEDDAFQVEQVWILTQDEAAQSPRQQNINQPRQQ